VRLFSVCVTAVALLVSGCYQQPLISPQRPLRCASSMGKEECPKGYACVADRVCAATSCSQNEDCPMGLTCSSRGCVLPPDGGGGDGADFQIPAVRDGGLRASPDSVTTDLVSSVPEDATAVTLPDATTPPDGGQD
jgi:hypothetical protein